MTNKKKMRQNIIIAVWAIATLFFAFLSVLALIPTKTDVQIREEIKVSSALFNAQSGEYEVAFSGALKNTTGEEITVERLEVRADGSNREIDQTVIVLENITVPARSTVAVSASAIGLENCDKVEDVSASYNGNTEFLRNPAEINPVGMLIPLAITAVLAFFLVRACKVRAYMAELERSEKS